ncbi:hypothetical protein AB1286_16065 [Trinickia sp. NRRL B-1857]
MIPTSSSNSVGVSHFDADRYDVGAAIVGLVHPKASDSSDSPIIRR